MPATAIVVPFHAAEAVVGAHRRALTGDGADGIGRHLPIRTRAVEVAVMEHGADGWRTREHLWLEPV